MHHFNIQWWPGPMLIFPKLKEWKICLKWSNLFLNKFDHFRQIKIVKDVTKCHGPICSLQCLVLFQIQKVTNLLASHVFSPFFSSRKLFVSKRLPWGITPITSLASWMYVQYIVQLIKLYWWIQVVYPVANNYIPFILLYSMHILIYQKHRE